MFKHFVETIESKYENSWSPSFFKVYHPQLLPNGVGENMKYSQKHPNFT